MLFHEVTVPKFSALLLNVMNNIQFNLVTLDDGENYFNISDHNSYIGMPQVNVPRIQFISHLIEYFLPFKVFHPQNRKWDGRFYKTPFLDYL